MTLFMSNDRFCQNKTYHFDILGQTPVIVKNHTYNYIDIYNHIELVHSRY